MANLTEMTPEMFLNAENLKSEMDGWSKPEYAQQQYEKGLETGKQANYVSVAVNNVWSAGMKSGGHLSSYEKLGYHGRTWNFWQGVLDSGCKIVVYRENIKGPTVIK